MGIEKEPFAVVVPLKSMEDHSRLWINNFLFMSGTDAEMSRLKCRINAAHEKLVSARLSAQREECCKAVCDVCAQDVPIIKNHHCFSFAHDFGDMVAPSVRYLNCRAAAIQALGEGREG